MKISSCRAAMWRLKFRASTATDSAAGVVPGRNLMLEFDAVARGDAEQVGGAPDHIVLELADRPIGIGDLPHHLHDLETAGLVDLPHDHAGEVVEIDRIALHPGGGGNQFVGGAVVEAE